MDRGLGGVGAAYAGSAKHSVPGTPGAPNCVGQTMAYLAQGNYDFGLLSGPGIGNIASETGLSVKQIHETVDAYCAGAFVSP